MGVIKGDIRRRSLDNGSCSVSGHLSSISHTSAK